MFQWVPPGGSRAARVLAVGALLHALSAPVSAQICAYVANENDGTVSVIDAASNLSTTAIAVGGSPSAIALAPHGEFAYASNIDPDELTVIDAVSGAVIKPIELPACTALLCGPEAVAIAPDGHHAYVPGPVDEGSHLLSVIDTVTNTVTDTIMIEPAAAPRGGGVAVTVDGLYACVSGYELETIAGQPEPDAVLYTHVLNVATKTLLRRTTNLGPIDSMQDFLDRAHTATVISPDSVCYVSDGFGRQIVAITVPDNSLVTQIPINTAPLPANTSPTGITITPDGKSVLVSAGARGTPPALPDEGRIFVIGTDTNMPTGTIQLRGHYLTGVAVGPYGVVAMTTDGDTNRVFVIDATSNRVTASIPVGSGPAGIAIGSVVGGCPGEHCVGDCNLDGAVTVDELITLAGIALQTTPISDCQVADVNGDHQITIDEILRAEQKALSGCTPA